MLVLSRKLGESILINNSIRVTVLAVRANQVRLGFSAPDDVAIFREELLVEATPDAPPARTHHPAPVTSS
jgi:carbon storage regulator